MHYEKIFRFALLLAIAISTLNCDHTARVTAERPPVSPEWDLIVVEQGAGQVSVLDGNGGVKKDSVKVGYNPHEIAISHDGRTAYISNFGIEDYDHTIGTPGLDIALIDLSQMRVKLKLPVNRSPEAKANQAPHGVKIRPGRDELFVNVEVGDSMLVYKVISDKLQRSFPLPKGAHNFIFSQTGDTLFLFSGAEGIFSFDPDTGEQLAHFSTATPARGLTYTLDGRRLLVSCGDEIYLLEPDDLSIYRHYPDLGVQQIIYSTPTPDGEHILAPCPYDGIVLLINMESGAIIRRLETGKAPIYVQIAPDQRQAFVANALDNHMSVIDLDNFDIRPFGQVDRPNGFAFLKVR